MSSIVCPSCKAYLGLTAAGAADCPRCAAPLAIATAEAPPGCPAEGTPVTESEAARRDVLYGGLWLLVGIAVTVGTYLFADFSGGSRFIVAWGAMLFGGLQFLRGLLAAGRK